MKEVVGNIWDYHKQGHWIVITTNGTVKPNGEAVMGRGVALQAKQRFPKLSYMVGQQIKHDGNKVFLWHDYRIITFPVKNNWWEKADTGLIELGSVILPKITLEPFGIGLSEVYMVRPGCGNGQLDWKDVKPILEKYLDDRFTVVNSIK